VVASTEQPPALAVPDGEGEGADETVRTLDTPPVVRGEEQLGVGDDAGSGRRNGVRERVEERSPVVETHVGGDGQVALLVDDRRGDVSGLGRGP